MATSSKTRLSLPPSYITDDPAWKRGVSIWINEANQGHIANTGIVTLLSGVAATTIADARAGANSYIDFMPTTANAAAELGAGTMYVSSQGKQTFTITHANAVTGDRIFRYCILG